MTSVRAAFLVPILLTALAPAHAAGATLSSEVDLQTSLSQGLLQDPVNLSIDRASVGDINSHETVSVAASTKAGAVSVKGSGLSTLDTEAAATVGGNINASASAFDQLHFTGQSTGTQAFVTFKLLVKDDKVGNVFLDGGDFDALDLQSGYSSTSALTATIGGQTFAHVWSYSTFIDGSGDEFTVSDNLFTGEYTVPFTFGESFGVGLEANDQTTSTFGGIGGAVTGGTSFDFTHAVAWGGITSVTVDGRPVAFGVTSDSGADYLRPLASTTAVPEPATYATLLAGLLLMAGLRSRRASKRRARRSYAAIAGAGEAREVLQT